MSTGTKKPKPSRARFDALRARYRAANATFDELERELRIKYGEARYASRGELTKLERLRDRRDKIGSSFFDLVRSISPRDWSRGVPVSWIYEQLTFDDAVRPKTEPLSVVVPLAYQCDEKDRVR